MPDIGEKMLKGVLESCNIIVPRRHVREALHKVDPVNTALRWSTRIKRRQYSVPSPNSLWHLDIEFCDCIVCYLSCLWFVWITYKQDRARAVAIHTKYCDIMHIH